MVQDFLPLGVSVDPFPRASEAPQHCSLYADE